MELTLAEQLLLLALDDAKGTESTRMSIDGGLAAALIMDLTCRGVLTVDEFDDFAVEEVAPGLPEPLERAARVIQVAKTRRGAAVWLMRLPRELKPIKGQVAAPLVARGVLSEQRTRVLGLVPRTRYPEANPAYERKLREGLRATLLGQREPTEDETLLMPLLHSYGIVEQLVPQDARKQAKARAAEVAARGPVSAAMTASVASAQAAALALTLASSHAGMIGDAGGGGGDGGGGG